MSLPRICTCPTVPAADCPFHHQDARGSLAAMPCSAITQAQLEEILIHEGIIRGDAIEDPFGYDGGMTELRVSIATREINALLRQQTGDGKSVESLIE